MLISVLSTPAFSAGAESARLAKVTVTEIKHWSNPDYTRIVISLSSSAKFSHKLLKQDETLKKPRRLFIDIAGAALDKALPKEIPINDGLLKTARAGQFDKETVRVVLDIESIEDYKVIPFEEPFRIVIDVTGKQTAIQKSAEVKATQAQPPPKAHTPKKAIRIVIDPGHGGKDPGAIGKSGLREKNVTLKITKLLKESLTKNGLNVTMTRDTDVFIPLEERTAIANSHSADLFVSVHINSSPRRGASGVETYILDVAKDEETRRLAARENSTSRKAVGDLEFILNDLIKTAKNNDAINLASAVNNKLVARLKQSYKGIRSNGVKGAPFYVLVRTRMPAILVEVSFISNAEDEKRLRTDKYVEEAAQGISAGVMSYLKDTGAL
ncbi:N-acetylmuramoyl-L-alanine amidase [bacterium]|nr:MAG: N-acetylmuramoyl-L-alanine amidase [bacterium]